jgi:NAD dependent epimerase/dehydratase
MELKNKRVLVTGADGFIGSHLVEALVHRGARVKALYYYNAFNHWGWLEDIDCLADVEAIPGDIRDPHFLKNVSKGMDLIFHLAALIAIPYSYTAPASYVDTNVTGTLNICQAGLENGCQRVIHTSTSEVYGTARYVPIDEGHPLQPQSPYSASKIGADAIAMSFHLTYALPLLIARPFNTYGPRQSARAIIPTLITQIAAGKKEIRVGNLSPTRDFNYVKDTVRAILLLAECDKAVGEIVNIGSDSEISIRGLTRLIEQIMQADVVFRSEKQRFRPDKSEVEQLRCNNSKIRGLVNYCPQFNLETGLQETIAWFEKNLEKYKVNIYNV